MSVLLLRMGDPVQHNDTEGSTFAYRIGTGNGVVTILQRVQGSDTWGVVSEHSPNDWQKVSGTRYTGDDVDTLADATWGSAASKTPWHAVAE